MLHLATKDQKCDRVVKTHEYSPGTRIDDLDPIQYRFEYQEIRSEGVAESGGLARTCDPWRAAQIGGVYRRASEKVGQDADTSSPDQ